MKKSEKDKLVLEISRFVETYVDPEDIGRACLYWSYATAHFLREAGINAILQAGTMLWPRKYDPALDDDDAAFGYKCDHDEFMMTLTVCSGRLPELHSWVGIPETNEIVDLTTKYLPFQCAKIFHKLWMGPPPPEYFWGPADDLPEGGAYIPCICATAITWAVLNASVDMMFGQRLNVDLPTTKLLGA